MLGGRERRGSLSCSQFDAKPRRERRRLRLITLDCEVKFLCYCFALFVNPMLIQGSCACCGGLGQVSEVQESLDSAIDGWRSFFKMGGEVRSTSRVKPVVLAG